MTDLESALSTHDDVKFHRKKQENTPQYGIWNKGNYLHSSIIARLAGLVPVLSNRTRLITKRNAALQSLYEKAATGYR